MDIGGIVWSDMRVPHDPAIRHFQGGSQRTSLDGSGAGPGTREGAGENTGDIFARGSTPPTERYVLTSSGEEGTACSQTSIMHHW